MPALHVSIDGNPIATVSTEGNEVLALSIHGSLVEEEFAHLDIDGGPQGKYLAWIPQLPIKAGQSVLVQFLEHGESSCAGKTIEEMFPEEEVDRDMDFTSTAQQFAELRSKPKARERFSFNLSSGEICLSSETRSDDYGFGFTVLWNSFHPERARFSLHSYTLDELESKAPMNYLAQERLNLGGEVKLVVSA